MFLFLLTEKKKSDELETFSSISYVWESQDASSLTYACDGGNNLPQFPSQKSGQTWNKIDKDLNSWATGPIFHREIRCT